MQNMQCFTCSAFFFLNYKSVIFQKPFASSETRVFSLLHVDCRKWKIKLNCSFCKRVSPLKSWAYANKQNTPCIRHFNKYQYICTAFLGLARLMTSSKCIKIRFPIKLLLLILPGLGKWYFNHIARYTGWHVLMKTIFKMLCKLIAECRFR